MAAVTGAAGVELFRRSIHCPLVIYVISYPVFEPVLSERIDDFRGKHEPQRAKVVPPHVTLMFGVGEEHSSAVRALVEDLSARTRAFSITFDGYEIAYDPFEKKHKIFLLCGAGSGKLTALHKQLYDGKHRAELSVAHPFRPHMTIATYEERSSVEQVDISGVGDLPIEGKISSLELVRFVDGRLTALHSAPFRGML